ncbi:hypothetical protein SUDANB146_01294 [Streptomyces sp. enrichment culture]
MRFRRDVERLLGDGQFADGRVGEGVDVAAAGGDGAGVPERDELRAPGSQFGDQGGEVRVPRVAGREDAQVADHRALVFPAHLPGQGAFEIRREGSGFGLSRRAPFSRT